MREKIHPPALKTRERNKDLYKFKADIQNAEINPILFVQEEREEKLFPSFMRENCTCYKYKVNKHLKSRSTM